MEGKIMFNKKNKKKVIIEGMMCSHCAEKVEKTLMTLDNVSKVKVDLKDKSATIFYDKSLNEEEIKNKIAELEYKVIEIKEI